MTPTGPRVGLVVRDIGTMGGIARYVRELADGMPAAGVDARVVLVGEAVQDWRSRSPLHVAEPAVPLGGSLALLRIPRGAFDVLHFPLIEPWPVFAARAERLVMTVHSVEPLFLPSAELNAAGPRVTSKLPYRLLRAVERRLRFAVTPSETTASQIERYLGVPRERIRVIPHGVSPAIAAGPTGEAALRRASELGLDRPYVLHVGHQQPQKNVVRLIEAFARLERDDVDLAIVGDTTRCAGAYAAAVSAFGVEARVRFLGPVAADETLGALYRAARVFALPSLQESFGLPLLEALACGCPALVSAGTGAADTAGGAALEVEPRSIESIAGALARLLDDEPLRADLAPRGMERAREFTWERSVAAHAAVYEEAMR